jgi:DNA-binding NarL/FixJ family response regulator
VLLAEDHKIVREGIKQLLGMADDLQVVGEAGNGLDALGVLRQTPCDVLLLDISMPGLNGLELIARIRGQDNAPAILVLSMHNEAQMAARALKAGARGYTTKDSDPALLLSAIRKVAAGGRYIDPQLADRMVFEVGLTDARVSGVRTPGAWRQCQRYRPAAHHQRQDRQHPQGQTDAETAGAIPGGYGALRH